MAHSDVVTRLFREDFQVLASDLQSVRQMLDELRREESILEQLIAAHPDRPVPVADGRAPQGRAAARREAMRRDAARRHGLEDPPGAQLRPPDVSSDASLSAQILELFEHQPSSAWLSYEHVESLLSAAGIDAPRNSIRVAVRRWVEREQLEHDERENTFRESPRRRHVRLTSSTQQELT